MLNATLCATGRAICCLLETYQEANGVRIPEVLVPFMGGLTFLPFVRDSKIPEKASKSEPRQATKIGANETVDGNKISPPMPIGSEVNAQFIGDRVAAKSEEIRKLKVEKAI